MNPFQLVAQAQAEGRRLEQVSKAVLAARPLNLVALWETQRAAERARQRARQVQRRLDTWRCLRWVQVGTPLSPVDAGRRRLSREALKKALGSLEAWLLALEQGSWHILHFIGHGGFDTRREEGVLALAKEQGKPFYAEIGRKGGESTKRTQGFDFYSRIGKVGGEAGMRGGKERPPV